MNAEKVIKNAIKGSGNTMESAAVLLGMKRGNVYYHLKNLSKDFIELLNLRLQLSLNPDNLLGGVSDETFVLRDEGVKIWNVKDELIASLQKTIVKQEEIIEMQKQQIVDLKLQVNKLERRRSA